MNEIRISMNTVRFFKRIMRPIAEEGIISLPEYNEAISQLTSLAEHGVPNLWSLRNFWISVRSRRCSTSATAISKSSKPRELSRSKEKW